MNDFNLKNTDILVLVKQLEYKIHDYDKVYEILSNKVRTSKSENETSENGFFSFLTSLTSLFEPILIVTGLSVFFLKVKQGLPRNDASS